MVQYITNTRNQVKYMSYARSGLKEKKCNYGKSQCVFITIFIPFRYNKHKAISIYSLKTLCFDRLFNFYSSVIHQSTFLLNIFQQFQMLFLCFDKLPSFFPIFLALQIISSVSNRGQVALDEDIFPAFLSGFFRGVQPH